MTPTNLYIYFVCSDPDKYWEGQRFNDYAKAISHAKSKGMYLVEVSYTYDDWEISWRPS